MAGTLNICAISHDLWKFLLTREKLGAIRHKSKCKIKRMTGKEKSPGFKATGTWVHTLAAPPTTYVTLTNLPNLSLSQVPLQSRLKSLTSRDLH